MLNRIFNNADSTVIVNINDSVHEIVPIIQQLVLNPEYLSTRNDVTKTWTISKVWDFSYGSSIATFAILWYVSIDDEDNCQEIAVSLYIGFGYTFEVTWIVQDIRHKVGLFYFSMKIGASWTGYCGIGRLD
ncbi:hypothetical protein Tco_0841021 [Tanacetum coccineum]|uniref:Uncharacterized protein n=1 Tax=Tanacetum coccineum TaxID=301880 RepID=A0ABQ5AX18_9ASTR